jgi:hypothetical protein
MRPLSTRRVLTALFLGAVAAACSNAGADFGLSVNTTNAVSVVVYLDRDGSRTPSIPIDTAFSGARVALLVTGSGDTVKTVTTNSAGLARFNGVPLGRYTVVVVPSSIGDSIEVQKIEPESLTVGVSDTNTVVLARLGYPEVSIRQARALPTGRRVFIRGIVLAGVQSFRDTTSHVADSSGQIRLTRVSLRGGAVGNAPGDSVSVLGLTSSRAGQPTLDNALISKFGQRPAPTPLDVGTGTAATANNGALDAALVRVTGALISDTTTVAPDFRVVANDGSGTLNIILDANISFNRAAFRPGRSMIVKGVLVPDGQGGWSLKPREVSDVLLL